MRHAGFFVRFRARLDSDERGFGLLETVIAVTVVLGSLMALAYTATIGFGYASLARQRQSATGIANQVMEQVRGLAYEKVQTGMLTSDLATDPTNIVTGCGGDAAGVYRFLSCTPGTIPGSGEKIVHSAAATNPTVPLVPHQGTITKNAIDFTWQTYVTNNCTAVEGACTAVDPYRVTVWVSWTGGWSYPTKYVRIQSLFYSPTGCRSTATHPFAAPCQPFFFATANVPQGGISVSGSVEGLTFQTGSLLTGDVESSVQQEQLSQTQGGYTPVGVSVTDNEGTRTAGAVTGTTTAADTDPGSPGTTYSTSTLTPPASSSTVQSPSGGGSVRVELTMPAGDTARSDSTTSAGGTNVCPPPTDTAETDTQPCAGTRQQQGGALTSVLYLDGMDPDLDDVTLVSVDDATNDPNKTFVNRVIYPASATCAPVSGADGCLVPTAARRFGAINIGTLPRNWEGPGGWKGGNPWNGYFLSVVNYQDDVSAPVGRNELASSPSGTAVPNPTSVQSGTLYYWNPTTSNYSSVAVDSASLATLNVDFSHTQTVGGRTVTVRICFGGTVPACPGAASAQPIPATISTASTAGGTGNLSKLESTAQATPPKVTISYQIIVDGSTKVDLLITVNLGTLEARGVYSPAPAQGS